VFVCAIAFFISAFYVGCNFRFSVSVYACALLFLDTEQIFPLVGAQPQQFKSCRFRARFVSSYSKLLSSALSHFDTKSQKQIKSTFFRIWPVFDQSLRDRFLCFLLHSSSVVTLICSFRRLSVILVRSVSRLITFSQS
jgi:hypothetical protein